MDAIDIICCDKTKSEYLKHFIRKTLRATFYHLFCSNNVKERERLDMTAACVATQIDSLG